MEKIAKVIAIFIFGLFVCTTGYSQSNVNKKETQKSNFSNSSFSSKKDAEPKKQAGPPGPGGGTGGNPVPINGGIGLLLAASIFYWSKKANSELKK